MFKTISEIQHRFDFHNAPVQTDLKPYQNLLDRINKLNLETVSQTALEEYAMDLKRQALEDVPMEQLMVNTYALVREVSRRLLGLRPFDTQILAGIALHQGKIIEMLTGEGKTLAAVLPACLNALTGRGVHILTFNDYLAKRDALWMGPIFKFFGLSVGYIQSDTNPPERKKAYNCDVTYVTAKEAGFDYLRSFLCYNKEDILQRPFNFAIVDEADSILVDEGRIPLVIAGSCPREEPELGTFAEMVREFKQGTDYSIDENKRNIYLTDLGIMRAEKQLQCGNLYTSKNLTLLTGLNNALHAQALLQRDVDYIIEDGRVELVDEFTGRVVENRHWPDGLQEAVEAKEELARRPGGRILGSITMQHFLNAYPKISGMTGTAQTAANDFKEFYNLDVVVIPPNRPNIRLDYPDLVFTHNDAKFAALVQEIIKTHDTGRPILIGTGSVQESEVLAGLLDQTNVKYQLLNAKNDEWEAEIIAGAGAFGAVTISTNMAGRGTDIQLGGAGGSCIEQEQIRAMGGLYVIGANRFESARIDNQLRGRAGRQGDPGSTRFFISLDDDLMQRYGIKELIPLKYRHLKQNGPIEDPVVASQIVSAQKIIEAQNYEIRRNLWKYSWILEKHRLSLHEWRQNILLGKEKPSLFKTALPERYCRLAVDFGEEVLQQAEKDVTLSQLDRHWADFLEEAAELRESIHLVHFSGKVPLDEYHKIMRDSYQDLRQRIDQEIIKKLSNVEITKDGIDLDKEGLRGPSATWTYLINDTPFGSKIEMTLAPIFKRFLKKSSETILKKA